MNEYEIDRIAAAFHQLRPDWPTKQLRTLLTDRLADRPRRDVAVALAWVASESGSASPYRVLENGPWWRAVAADQPDADRRRPPKPEDECPKHRGLGQWAGVCAICRGPKTADEEPGDRDLTRGNSTPQPELVRALRSRLSRIGTLPG